MYCQRLVLRDFRAYVELTVDLPRGLNVFLGPNAAGKTTLLEAVCLLATTKSPRTANDAELVRRGELSGRAAGVFVSHEGTTRRLAVGLGKAAPGQPFAKRLEVDGGQVASARDVVSLAPVVMFGPDDLALVKAGPEHRRRFLNSALSQIRPRYFDDLLRYRRALRQRNELLRLIRDGAGSPSDLGPWTEQLVRTGVALALDRQDFVAHLARHSADLHGVIGHGEELAVAYRGELSEADSPQAAEATFRERLARVGDLELRRGTTLSGPHRDDLRVEVDGVPARTFGSQGQQRTAALSLKLAQARVAQEWATEPPLLLLDDCLSELDQGRAEAVLDLGLSLDGMLVTSAKLDPALADRPDATRHYVGMGMVTRGHS